MSSYNLIKENKKLPKWAHKSQGWYIHNIATDFELEDVWAVPVEGEQKDFKKFITAFIATPLHLNGISKFLMALRMRMGKCLGWDKDMKTSIPGSLKRRLPHALRETVAGFNDTKESFKHLYLLENEFADEISNKTMHGIFHIGFVSNATNNNHIQLAILVKPIGILGKTYMSVIKPFRHLFIYPSLMKSVQQTWEQMQAAQQKYSNF